MNCLDKFREEIPAPNGKKFEAFRMDNTQKNIDIPDMRQHVGLGTCECCDYFLIQTDRIILVEQTRLFKTIETLQNECIDAGLKPEEEKVQKYISKNIMQENYVKVYGTLLVLWRLIAKCKESEELIGERKNDFWLVVEGTISGETSFYFDQLAGKLYDGLRSKLSTEMIGKVEIIPFDNLAEKLSKNATTP